VTFICGGDNKMDNKETELIKEICDLWEDIKQIKNELTISRAEALFWKGMYNLYANDGVKLALTLTAIRRISNGEDNLNCLDDAMIICRNTLDVLEIYDTIEIKEK
jgi:hypothetical protein